MNKVRIKAIKLRKQGKSYNEITRAIGVPKSTLSGWLKDIHLTEDARSRLRGRVRQGRENGLIKRNKLQTKQAQERAKQIRSKSSSEVNKLSERELMLVGAALYWGEGYKKAIFRDGFERTSHPISFVNADPEMIFLFINFLKNILHTKNKEIVLTMRLYDHINEKLAKQYWKSVTKLNDANFRKTTFLVSGASKRKRPKDSLPYGTLQVGLYKTDKFHELMGMIEGLKKSQ